MDIIAPLVALTLFLGALCVPIWFVVKIAVLLSSKGGRARIKEHRLFFLALGVLSLWLVILVSTFFPSSRSYSNSLDSITNIPVTKDSSSQCDAIVEGHFFLRRFIFSSRDVLSDRYGRTTPISVSFVPFQVDGSAKGALPQTISIKIFFPVQMGMNIGWEMPFREEMLLYLKEDVKKAGAYDLLSQNSSWLVIVHAHGRDSVPSDPNRFVLEDATDFLSACMGNPNLSGSIDYFSSLPSFLDWLTPWPGGLRFPQSDPARQHALDIGKELGGNDARFLAVARQYESQPSRVGEIARDIRAESGDYSGLTDRLKSAKPFQGRQIVDPYPPMGDENFQLAAELGTAISEAKDLGKLLPAVTLALKSSDPRVRLLTVQALRERQYRGNEEYEEGNRLGNRFYPLVARLLDDPNQDVQYSAMGCLFDMSGAVRQPFGHRDLDLWAIPIFEKKPQFYINQYKVWWAAHQSTLSP